MLRYSYYTHNIKIHKEFPYITLIKIMKPYLNLYLHALYSTESNKKINYEHLLHTGLKQFARYNPRFGRKIFMDTTKNNNNVNKKYCNNINDKHIVYIDKYDNDFMNNHLTLIDDDDDDDDDMDSDDDTEDDGTNTHYTSDEEIIIGTYNIEDNSF